MNWFKRKKLSDSYKALPIQDSEREKEDSSDPLPGAKFSAAYNLVEVIRRGCDMVADLSSEINYDIKEKLVGVTPKVKVTERRLNLIINLLPSQDEDLSLFRRKLILDLLLTGNAFIYFDGASLFRIPAKELKVVAGTRRKVQHYEYRSTGKMFSVAEIIHIQDNATSSRLTGSSRLLSATNSVTTLFEMLSFQKTFFKNGAVPGLIITSPNVLGKKIKERLIDYWVKTYSPKMGGKRPLILDGDLKIQNISNSTFKELDFETSVTGHEKKILAAIGVPPLLLDSGNNANIRPNMQLLYFTTIIPLNNKIMSAYEAFFGYDLALDTSKIASLQPELREQAAFQSTLVNAGIITADEARANLRYPEMGGEASELRIPANIAGSAVNPSEGGKPKDDES